MDTATKELLTQLLISQLPDSELVEYNTAIRTWWATFTYSKSLRLSEEGMSVLETLGYESTSFDLNSPMLATPRGVMMLQEKIKCPYYLTKTTIVIYDSRVALMIALHGGVLDYCNNT